MQGLTNMAKEHDTSRQVDDAAVEREQQQTATDDEQVVRPYVRKAKWALAEIGVVTVGILIAFSLNAWWDNRSAAQQEQVHLRALASDFEQNVEELRRLVTLEESVAAHSLALLERARAEEQEPAQALEPLMAGVFNSARFEPVMGAYEGLVNGGGLSLIQDDVLRAALAYFAAQVRNRYAESWSNTHYFEFSQDFGGRFLLASQENISSQQREQEFRAMLRDPEFQSHLALRYYSERDMAHRYADLLQQAEAVLARVQSQLQD